MGFTMEEEGSCIAVIYEFKKNNLDILFIIRYSLKLWEKRKLHSEDFFHRGIGKSMPYL